MKAVIYYEGPSEREMINQLLYKSSQVIIHTEDYKEFLDTPINKHCILFYDCKADGNVFPSIAKTPYYYKNDEQIIIIRDLETTDCFILLKDELNDYCPKLPEARTKPIFAKYTLEHVYLADLDIFKQVFRLTYRRKNGKEIPDNERFEKLIDNLDPIKPDLKGIFRAYGIAFHKPAIAREFFARFDFHNSNHPYFIRLVKSLHKLLHEAENGVGS